MTDRQLELKAVALRRAMLQLIFHSGAGPTGGGLSCMDILSVLDEMRADRARLDWFS